MGVMAKIGSIFPAPHTSAAFVHRTSHLSALSHSN
jgi:hypothetical protein